MKLSYKLLSFYVAAELILCVCRGEEDPTGGSFVGAQRFQLEGRVTVPNAADVDWVTNARVLVDGGQYLGILKSVLSR